MNLITVEKLEEIFFNTENLSGYRANLSGHCIPAAQKEISSLLNYSIAQETYSKLFDGDGSDRIYLPSKAVDISSVEVWIDEERVFGDDTKLDSEDFYCESWGEVVLYNDYFSIGRKNIKINYIAGYSEEDCPEDLIQAIANISMFNHSQGNEFNALTDEDFDSTAPKINKLKVTALKLIEPYKRWVI